ncbi:uncharacterized protein TRAVEDRAFT_53808 [Trametes versicolor FP-101664 SS1]|uniref:uncharacterized protein n=1 Tax=Trametes versicolor (strain FP-101664) TaxID=717944 RepID=UPI0004621275|nr:uncharacterized protein TRAVEDRAFT_53808 [Trametes versicolor FP-101664 SS1]EIW52386.1 hypothetical protein TRAVEDRAFT_53808 [Trametes versicolor FP-101664 SS1]
MNSNAQTFAMPSPRYYAPYGAPGSKAQPHASSSRLATPYRPSPLSTPAISEATSETETSEDHASSVVQCDEESILRPLGLSEQDMQSAHSASWGSSETPSEVAWLTQRRAMDARQRFQSASKYAVPVPSSSTALNPRAGEFIPVAARLQGPPPGLGTAVLRLQHPWMASFRRGSVTHDPNVRAQYAREIVRSGHWDTSVMTDLARKFAERVTESNGEDLNVVALLARAINSHFAELGGEVCANAFREIMMYCLWVEFDAFWNPNNPTSFICTPRKTENPTLSVALSFVAFSGELYAVKIVNSDFVRKCLNGLVADMFVIEQLRAARVLLTRLDCTMFKENPQVMNDIVAAINNHALRIVPGQSSLGEVFDQRTVHVQVEDINAAAKRWAAPERRAHTKEAFADSGFTPRVFAPDTLPPPPGLKPSPQLVYATARTIKPARR